MAVDRTETGILLQSQWSGLSYYNHARVQGCARNVSMSTRPRTVDDVMQGGVGGAGEVSDLLGGVAGIAVVVVVVAVAVVTVPVFVAAVAVSRMWGCVRSR